MPIDDERATAVTATVQSIVSRYQEANHLSDAEMAEKLGVSRQTIWRWRTGGAEPSEDQIMRIVGKYRLGDWAFQMAVDIAECQMAALKRRIGG